MKTSFCTFFLLLSALSAVAEVSFNRDIRPLLSDRCFACHGPDGGEHGEKWRGGLRLDTKEGAFADLAKVKHVVQTAKRAAKGLAPLPAPTESRFAIVADKPEASALIYRIMTDDPDDRMPPEESHLNLSAKEKALLRQWIGEGAKWDGHWAFQTPKKPAPSRVRDTKWANTDIDPFVLARLEANGIKPAPEVDKRTWLRRVTQDITGLPPTLADINAFTKDRSRDAYGKVVDRLLASDDYAERMTAIWLDNARYADSNGFQFDNARTMWPWRSWVIDAYRQNMPYDQFVTEQLAGDLLSKPTQAQLIATGFNRNHGYSIEGGITDEEYRVMYANDKTTTAGTLFLGLTFECTRCHDHKYDPLTMTDYYSFFAFFNSSAEKGAPGEGGRKQKAAAPHIPYELPQVSQNKPKPPAWKTVKPASATAVSQTLTVQSDAAVLASGDAPKTDIYTVQLRPNVRELRSVRLEALTMPRSGKVGRDAQGNFVLSDFRLTLINGDKRTPLPIAGATATFNQQGFPVGHSIDSNPKTGWAVFNGRTKNQTATYTLAKTAKIPAGATIEARLAFESPHVTHVMGRFRLSLSPQQETLSKAQKAKPILAMIMSETPRKSYVLTNGLFDQPGKEVKPLTPAVLPAFEGVPANRLGLAQWLTAAENPLFARVTVNRVWQQFFGIGLVKTVDNFGMQGEQPSHPALLDWLATDFRENGWDMHHLIRQIVLSATYRQSAVFRPELEDPDNRLLARGPTFRLPAEMIRDQALAVSGLLTRQIGGPSVKPYQPSGVWEDLNAPRSHAERYAADKGTDLYRKSMYTYWRRAALHPAMLAFDAPSRDVCAVSRESTNTPLQALVTLHGPTYIEAARHLAEGAVGKRKPIEQVFETILSRPPTARERRVLERLHKARLQHYQDDSAAAARLLKVGASPADPKRDAAQVAALADVCHAILNLSETITRK